MDVILWVRDDWDRAPMEAGLSSCMLIRILHVYHILRCMLK